MNKSTDTIIVEMEDLLSCPICGDFIKTAMTLSCSHSYCSQCIRKSLNTKEQCPVCRTKALPSDLRNNRIIDEIIIRFNLLKQNISAPQVVIENSINDSFREKRTEKQIEKPLNNKRKCDEISPSFFESKKPKLSPSKKQDSSSKDFTECPICSCTLKNTDSEINKHIIKSLCLLSSVALSPSTGRPY
eukprot:c18062_g1_i4.p2 GENE.c18062_g1_i4~~c18062_g1_i4.p2  ORF type:complete len:188 (+),score=36.30 c18062_g1_i4:15-578(+)